MFTNIIKKIFPNYYKSDYKVFVFDLDNTITNTHTGGHYEKGTYKKFISPIMLKEVRTIFKKIKEDGGKIYINSRGIASKVYDFCNDTGLNVFVDGYYAANYDGRHYKHGKIETEFKLDNNIWHIIKSLYLTRIVKKENIQPDNLYYFDDTRKNINYAKNTGFINSYLVNSNKYHKVDGEYNLIKVFHEIY
jgi:HAD superfamily phosphatase (TIGR01681 family)